MKFTVIILVVQVVFEVEKHRILNRSGCIKSANVFLSANQGKKI
jgi:hypothetical protein